MSLNVIYFLSFFKCGRVLGTRWVLIAIIERIPHQEVMYQLYVLKAEVPNQPYDKKKDKNRKKKKISVTSKDLNITASVLMLFIGTSHQPIIWLLMASSITTPF